TNILDKEEKFCQHEGFCVTFNEGEIKAEVGLCAVIPCAFTSLFAPEYIIWYKCEPLEAKCDNSDPVFHSGKNKENIQPEYEGRMSLLNLNMTQKNCSIMINDLKKSDSGWYHDLFPSGLSQKPSVMIPPLTEGQQVTLTCTAPGLCSGSPPNITWMWRGKGEKDSHIIGNTTALKTENLTAFTQRHVSTLTFNYSADHHNTSITCKVSFTGGITTEETVTLNVTCDISNVTISGRATVREGDDLNLTCSVDSFPPTVIGWSKSTKQAEHQSHNLTKVTIFLFSITNVTAKDAGLYICTAKYPNYTLREEINVTVKCVLNYFIWSVNLQPQWFFFSFLQRNSRKKVKPTEDDQTYISLQKPDTSEYDVIVQRPH
uniref:Ig-like domain-containing protein n=1 Tax=Poecilia mexicana TaxID=48701 RepID=A0A3B3X184_9TELE